MVKIAQFLDKEADWGSSGQMEMVNHWLWHHIEQLVEIAREEGWKLLVVCSNHNCIILIHHLRSQFCQNLTCFILFFGQIDITREMLLAAFR